MKLASAPHRIQSGSLRPRPSRPGFGGLIPCSSASQIKHGRGHRVPQQDRSRSFSSVQSSTSEAVCGVTPSVESLYSRALMLARSEDFEQARELFQTVAERFPYHEKNWISWAQMEKRAHAMNSEVKWNTCRQVLQQALSVNPTGARLIQAWGLMELQKRNFWAAVTMLDRSVLYDPFLKPVLLWKPVLEAQTTEDSGEEAQRPPLNKNMAGVVEKVKNFCAREWQNERAREANKNLLKAVAFFAGAVLVSRNFGDAFAI